MQNNRSPDSFLCCTKAATDILHAAARSPCPTIILLLPVAGRLIASDTLHAICHAFGLIPDRFFRGLTVISGLIYLESPVDSFSFRLPFCYLPSFHNHNHRPWNATSRVAQHHEIYYDTIAQARNAQDHKEAFTPIPKSVTRQTFGYFPLRMVVGQRLGTGRHFWIIIHLRDKADRLSSPALSTYSLPNLVFSASCSNEPLVQALLTIALL